LPAKPAAFDALSERVRLLYASLPAALVSSAVVAFGLTVLLAHRIAATHLVSWLVCLVLPLAQGAAIGWSRARSPTGSVSDRVWLRRFRCGVAVTGAAWGLSSVLLFPPADLRLQAVVFSAVAMVTAGASTSLSVDLMSAALFSLPALVPIIARLLLTGEALAVATAAMLSILLTFIAMSAVRSNRSLRENLQLRDAAAARERELHLREEFLDRTGRLAGVGGWDYEHDGQSLRWTAQTYRIHELDPGTPLDVALALQHFPAPAREELEDAIAAALRTSRDFDLELPLLTAKDRLLWVRVIGRPRFDNGTAVGVSGALQDISARKAADAALIAARDEAERANLAKTQFLSNMSHELRTPLNAVLGFAQLLQTDRSQALTPSQDAYVRHILTAGNHLLQLINQLLDLSRAEAGKFQLDLIAVDAGEVIADCLTLVQPQASERNVRLQVLDHLDAPPVTADRLRLKQVLLNLLSNAIKFNRVDGEVEVLVHPEDATIKISVRDTGSGVTPAQQPLLFRVFERLEADRAEISGTGIGLALSKQLVELMGGEIGMSSESGVGSVFWIRLKRAPRPHAIA
jgi:signal transduction histidine kinase